MTSPPAPQPEPVPAPAPRTWQAPPPALRGVRVLDFSHVIAGPFATFQLAQMGAEVTKVERPGGGDVMRRAGAGAHAFTALNAGKQPLALDLATPEGRARALDLAHHTDVLVDNYRPGVLDRHGLGYEQVKAVNPRVVYCAISGYGHGDPALTPRGAYDHVMQALTGMTMLAGQPDDPPIKIGFPVIDAATGLVAALAVMAALRERDHSGQGSFLDVSMWASALQLMYPFTCDVLSTGQDIARVGNKGFSGSPAADTFACRDGWLALGANTPAHVAALMQTLGVESARYGPLLDPGSGAGPSFARARDPAAFRELLAAELAGHSAADLEHRLNAAGVPAARVRSLREFAQQATASGLLQPLVLGEGQARAVTPGLGWRVAD